MRRVATFLALSVAMAGIPAAQAHADAFKPSKKQQVDLGTRAARQVRQEEKILPDNDRRVRMMREVASRLLATWPERSKEPWKFSFDVIESKELNAFAFPGGPIFFYTGLLDKFETEDELAGVLAHEITHVRKEHWAYAYADAQKRSLGLAVVLSLLNANRTVSDLASITNDVLLSTKFSRKAENESDEMGYVMMVKAGYNPQGMADAFRILKKSSRGGGAPEWASTHPDIDRRIQAIENRISKSGANYPAQRPLPWNSPAHQSR
jgi:predicted Zn-dependent protease